jgi:predicted phosphoribosyltransferase
MPERKPAELVQVNFRMRESLRQRLLREATKKGIPVAHEVAERLEASFDAAAVRSIEAVAADLVAAHRKTAIRLVAGR